MDYEIVADHPCLLGEGPLWNGAEQKLYWTDIFDGKLFAFDPATGENRQIYAGEQVGGFTFQAAGGLLLFGERGSIRQFDGETTKDLVSELPEERLTRFNDVVADPMGRVFAGTIPVPGQAARLYRMDLDGSLRVVANDIGLSNGLAFSPDQTKMYYSDSGSAIIRSCIYVFDYDRATGELSNRQVFQAPGSPDDIPDGLTVDAQGYIWSARHCQGCVIRFAPDGREDYRITVPAKLVTSCTFGGEDLGDLYITSAGGEHRGEPAYGAWAGALFRVRPGVKGLPERLSRVKLPSV